MIFKPVFPSLMLLALSAVSGSARAYQVDSQFSRPCHELISIAAYNGLLDDVDTSRIPLPESTTWQKLAETLEGALGISYGSRQEQLILVSLVVGTRAPDTQGHSVANFVQLREIHLDPEGQHHHALRAPNDNGHEGDLSAITGTREWIHRQVEAISVSLSRAPDRQIITVKTFLDFYGRVDVEVWEPAFRMGVAAHAMQDTFTHMLRSADTSRVHHVLNYADAVNGDYDEPRDGMAHSDSLDDCSETGPVRDLARSARRATEALFAAMGAELQGGDTAAVGRVLDAWMTHQPGCTESNDYCDSPWLEAARVKLSGPYLCNVSAGGAADPWRDMGLPWAVALLALMARRWRHRHPRYSSRGTPSHFRMAF